MVEPIQLGTKPHSFREDEKDRWHVGRLIHFVTRFRQLGQYQFYATRPLTGIQPTIITEDAVFIEGRQLDPPTLALFAQRDGFASPAELFAFFAKAVRRSRAKLRRPLTGKLLHWTDLRY